MKKGENLSILDFNCLVQGECNPVLGFAKQVQRRQRGIGVEAVFKGVTVMLNYTV